VSYLTKRGNNLENMPGGLRSTYRVSVGMTPTAPCFKRLTIGSNFQESEPDGSASMNTNPSSCSLTINTRVKFTSNVKILHSQLIRNHNCNDVWR